GRLQHQALEAAREGEPTKPRPLRRPRMRKILDRLDHLVEGVDPDHADGFGNRIEAVERARERSGMRKRSFAALLGAADLHGDDRFPRVARKLAGTPETTRIPDGLDEAGDR